MTLPRPFAFPTFPTPISIADINAECGYAVNTQHGLDWVFEITRPEERPAASGYTPVNVTDQVSGGTIAVANSNIAHYETSSVCTPPNDIFPPAGNLPLGWAYYNNDLRGSNCDNGNCANCSGSNCGNIGGDNCTTTQLADCIVPDTRAWLQQNCNCACSFNCDQVTYSHNCNCACPWICACACW
jgi:hypothetical protein